MFYSLKNNILVMALLFSILSLLTMAVNAEFDNNLGVVDSVNHEQARLVIDDQSFYMALNFKVYDKRGKEVNRYSVKVGQKVTYTFTDNPNGSRSISSLHVRPKNYSLSTSDED